MALLAVLAAASILAGEAPAVGEAFAGAPPRWLRMPSGLEIAEVYPADAANRGLSGTAVISCTVDGRGHMTKCVLISEDPAARGFGPAALKLGRRFILQAKTDAGLSTEGATMRIPIAFSMTR